MTRFVIELLSPARRLPEKAALQPTSAPGSAGTGSTPIEAPIAEVELLEGRVVEVQHRRHQCVVGLAADSATDERLVEELERADHGDVATK